MIESVKRSLKCLIPLLLCLEVVHCIRDLYQTGIGHECPLTQHQSRFLLAKEPGSNLPGTLHLSKTNGDQNVGVWDLVLNADGSSKVGTAEVWLEAADELESLDVDPMADGDAICASSTGDSTGDHVHVKLTITSPDLKISDAQLWIGGYNSTCTEVVYPNCTAVSIISMGTGKKPKPITVTRFGDPDFDEFPYIFSGPPKTEVFFRVPMADFLASTCMHDTFETYPEFVFRAGLTDPTGLVSKGEARVGVEDGTAPTSFLLHSWKNWTYFEPLSCDCDRCGGLYTQKERTKAVGGYYHRSASCLSCKSQTDLATGLNMCLEMNAWCLAEEGELATIQSCKTCDNAAGFYMIPPTTGECIPAIMVDFDDLTAEDPIPYPYKDLYWNSATQLRSEKSSLVKSDSLPNAVESCFGLTLRTTLTATGPLPTFNLMYFSVMSIGETARNYQVVIEPFVGPAVLESLTFDFSDSSQWSVVKPNLQGVTKAVIYSPSEKCLAFDQFMFSAPAALPANCSTVTPITCDEGEEAVCTTDLNAVCVQLNPDVIPFDEFQAGDVLPGPYRDLYWGGDPEVVPYDYSGTSPPPPVSAPNALIMNSNSIAAYAPEVTTFSGPLSSFTLESLYLFKADSSDAEFTVTLTPYVGDYAMEAAILTPSGDPVLFDINFEGVTKVTLVSSSSSKFAVDDVKITTAPAPEECPSITGCPTANVYCTSATVSHCTACEPGLVLVQDPAGDVCLAWIYDSRGGASPYLKIDMAPLYTISWDGNDGLHRGATSPSNLARNGVGIGSGELGWYENIHTIAHINDGSYGNSYSWIGGSEVDKWVGVRLNSPVNIHSFAFSRDNTNGGFSDRFQGNYTVQVTEVLNAGTTTPDTGNALTGWETIGILEYNYGVASIFSPHLRHEYVISKRMNGSPVRAAALRIKTKHISNGSPPGLCIDELEIYGLPV